MIRSNRCWITWPRRGTRKGIASSYFSLSGLAFGPVRSPIEMWSCNDPDGQVAWQLNLLESSGRPGRVISLSEEVRQALIAYRDEVTSFSGPHVISTERSLETSAQVLVNAFQRWYRHLGFVGCSSHSGRRTFIINAARKVSTNGGVLNDVQRLAGHANLRTTQRFLDEDLPPRCA
jgi:integrase/recombinase XerD